MDGHEPIPRVVAFHRLEMIYSKRPFPRAVIVSLENDCGQNFLDRANMPIRIKLELGGFESCLGWNEWGNANMKSEAYGFHIRVECALIR